MQSKTSLLAVAIGLAFLLAGCIDFARPGLYRPATLPKSGQPPLNLRVGIRPFTVGPGGTLSGKELEGEFTSGKSYPVTEQITGSFLRDLNAAQIFLEAGMAGANDQVSIEGEIVNLNQDRTWNGGWLVPGAPGYYILGIFGVPLDCGSGEASLVIRMRHPATGEVLGQWQAAGEGSECAGYYYDGRPLGLALSRACKQILSQIRRDAGEIQQAYAAIQGGQGAPVAPEPVPPAPPKEKAVIAVFDVQDAGRRFKPQILEQLTEYLAVKLTENGYRVIPRNQLHKRLMEEKKEGYKKCYDEGCQIELGRAVAAQKSLATKLLRVGRKCTLTATIYDLKSETTERAASITTAGCDADALLVGIDQISNKLAAR